MMIKIIAYSVKKEDHSIAKGWANDNHVDLTVLEEPLTMRNIGQVKEYDGISVAQTAPITKEIYETLAN